MLSPTCCVLYAKRNIVTGSPGVAIVMSISSVRLTKPDLPQRGFGKEIDSTCSTMS